MRAHGHGHGRGHGHGSNACILRESNTGRRAECDMVCRGWVYAKAARPRSARANPERSDRMIIYNIRILGHPRSSPAAPRGVDVHDGPGSGRGPLRSCAHVRVGPPGCLGEKLHEIRIFSLIYRIISNKQNVHHHGAHADPKYGTPSSCCAEAATMPSCCRGTTARGVAGSPAGPARRP